MGWADVGWTVLGQLGALAAFFGFPAVQYMLLRRLARREGRPELWYLPRFGFRLVMRNLPRKRTFTDIRYRALIRSVVRLLRRGPAWRHFGMKSSLSVRISSCSRFRSSADRLQVRTSRCRRSCTVGVHTDKLGASIHAYDVQDEANLIADFVANLENWFGFDISVARRVEITGARLRELVNAIHMSNVEQQFEVSRVRDVG